MVWLVARIFMNTRHSALSSFYVFTSDPNPSCYRDTNPPSVRLYEEFRNAAVSWPKPFRVALKLGREMALSSAYKLLLRHNRRNSLLTKGSRKAILWAQEDWEKNFPKRSPKSAKTEPKMNRSDWCFRTRRVWAHQRRASVLGSQARTTAAMPSYADPRVHLRLHGSGGQKWETRLLDFTARQY